SAISTDAAAGPGTGSRRAAGPRPNAADQGAIRGHVLQVGVRSQGMSVSDGQAAVHSGACRSVGLGQNRPGGRKVPVSGCEGNVGGGGDDLKTGYRLGGLAGVAGPIRVAGQNLVDTDRGQTVTADPGVGTGAVLEGERDTDNLDGGEGVPPLAEWFTSKVPLGHTT